MAKVIPINHLMAVLLCVPLAFCCIADVIVLVPETNVLMHLLRHTLFIVSYPEHFVLEG